jgi:hypothetical protein
MFEMQSEPMFAKAVGSGINSVDISADTVAAKIIAANNFTSAAGGVLVNELAVNANVSEARLTITSGPIGSPNDIVIVATNAAGAMMGINTPSPTQALHVVGNICATGTIGACSDERFKKNITTIGDALGLIERLRGVNFNWRTEEFPEQKFSDEEQVGFIAQELKEILPKLVSQGNDGYYSVDYSRLTPVLVEAVKEQQKEITSLKTEMQELKRLMQSLALAKSETQAEMAASELK